MPEITRIDVAVNQVAVRMVNAHVAVIRRHRVLKDRHQVTIREVSRVQDRNRRKRQDLKARGVRALPGRENLADAEDNIDQLSTALIVQQQ